MSKLQTMENIVLRILEDVPDTRADDCLLMLYVCAETNVNLLQKPFYDVMLSHKINGLPNWKSIERARRKIQEKRPDLINPKMAAKRKKEETEYREYAHS